MARSLEAQPRVRGGRIALPDMQDVIDLLDRNSEVLPFDPTYGETLGEILPRHLAELVTRH